MPSSRTRRNQKAGGLFDWLFGKKNESTSTTTSYGPVIPNGATAPMINTKPENATAVKITDAASPAVGGRRKKSYRKVQHKGQRKSHRKTYMRKSQRKSRRNTRRRY